MSNLLRFILFYTDEDEGSKPQPVPITWNTATGVSPLSLLNAIAHSIKSLKQYGKCVQDGTPTPVAPVPILCNNGEIKVSRNLCDVVSANIVVGKYINNSGVESSDTANFYYATYIPVTPGETYTMSTSSSIWYFSVMQYDSSKNFLRRAIWGATNTPVGTEKTFSVGSDCAYIRFGSNMKKAAISEADVLAVNWMLTQTATAQTFRPYGEIYTGGTHPGKNLFNPASPWVTHAPIGFSSNSAAWPNAEEETYPSSITYFMRVKPNTTYTYSCATAGDRFGVAGENSVVDPSDYTTASKLTFDSILVPLKSSSVGKTYTFTTGANTQMIAVYCALNTAPTNIQIEEGATATTYEAYTEIPYLPETLTVWGQNLVDLNAVTNGYYYDSSGVYTAIASARLTDFIPVKEGQKYTVYVKALQGGSGANVRCNLFNSAQAWKSQTYFVVTPGTDAVNTITPSENGYLRISANYTGTGAKVDWSVLQIVRGEYTIETMPPYEPYVAPQTATVVDLLGLTDDYRDTHELIHGPVTRDVGCMVVNGYEGDWVKVTSGTRVMFYRDSTLAAAASVATSDDIILCEIATHKRNSWSPSADMLVQRSNKNFGFMNPTGFSVDSTVTDWENFCKAHPFLVFYPLATEGTEQATPQSLHTVQGTNAVTVTSNVDPVSLEVEYAASA